MNSLVKSNGTPFPAIPSLLNDFFDRDWLDSTLANWRMQSSTLPAVNVTEKADHFVIDVAIPGMKREDFKVELDNNVLTISSQHEDSQEEKDNNGNYVRREFNYQAFQRSFSLPQNKIKGDEIGAKYLL